MTKEIGDEAAAERPLTRAALVEELAPGQWGAVVKLARGD